MKNPIKQKTVAAAVGSLLIGSVAGISSASADSPFAMKSMDSGYRVAMEEGKCGAGMMDKAKSGMEEGKCGGNMMKDKAESKAKDMGEGKCGAGMMDKAKSGMKEGKCGGNMMKDKAGSKAKSGMKEGKCGEGKCGGSK